MEVAIVLWIVSVVACWAIARHNGRNEGWAVFMGVLFGWIAFVVYLCMGKSFEKKLDEAHAIRKAQGLEL